MKRVVIIGGGTGVFTVLSGLKYYPYHLSAIVSMADDGGSTGVLREEFGILPPGDIRRVLVALSSSDNKIVSELFNYRFREGTLLKGHSLGNLLLTALERITGSFDQAKVIANANNTVSGVEFGIAAFDWNVGLTGSFTGLLSPVATLTFQAKPGTGGITDSLRFRFDGISSTTDSNVVANPAAVGDPEDILLQPQGSLSSVTVEIITPTITPTLTRTPTVAPSAARLRFKLQLPDILSSTTSILG